MSWALLVGRGLFVRPGRDCVNSSISGISYSSSRLLYQCERTGVERVGVDGEMAEHPGFK
jgi:hypothetical protein